MSRSISTTAPRFRFGNAPESVVVAAVQDTSSSPAFKLLLLFFLVYYSSIGVLVPALKNVRPAMIVAIAATLMMIVEMGQSRRSFRLAWPEGAMLIGLLGVTVVSTFDAIYLRAAVDTTSNLARMALIYVVIENTVTSESRLRKTLLTMVVGGLFPALGTIQHYLTGQLVDQGRASWVGTFANPNEDAYSLVILVPIAAALLLTGRWWQRLILVGVIGIYLVAIYLTFSRGCLLALFAVLGLLGWRQKSFVIKGLMIAALVGAVMFVSAYWGRQENFSDISADTTFNQRMATFRAGFAMFKDNPLFGVGPGCSIVAYPLYVPKEAHCGCQDQLVIHNAFIQMLSEIGLLGFLPFMLLLGFAILHAWKQQQEGPPNLQTYAMGLEVALWGFAVCGLSNGFGWSWFPYILVALVVAARHAGQTAPEQTA